MEKVVIFLITKTGVLRWTGALLAGWLINAGVTEDSSHDVIVGAVVAILTGLLSMYVNRAKTKDVIAVQKMVGAEPDGYLGPETKREIRRAIPVKGGDPGYNPNGVTPFESTR